ncbi:haloacid dehalogenase superfamily, subfamily IA, variant 3 with third motif having DD or ED/haloacid dehalogenase superfamily, subfamily IA, variant 1 with third motif having Dx(3-4)D or Dx(3-4)E [Selenomonas ruminantium]|uniref:Haloacid dehalogenase superfamily, subfamily IA, variant 3 with third motif having DD or ED/haloacid dehalogenase superfamily, subfamily IA, variant 1 with third motif having Dx(3-4)D or Dx(3-4)E n=1 Tax=Selenomonas ruminantium TaxID=971 RepID=A0A1M6TB59_SELRU|nr:HAD family hydrolase [Selenomonas ruminantium]SHK54066.1 haloacid dehalogenase superfamily, subfamily IA, variant 3 with third motif having DD or ED/haloacid dehalogenase superfamily, subfamily IA, variant 1 with third motif having Dx(3-4)D or Dx(3-4)E [Selenomonas ruminantium]
MIEKKAVIFDMDGVIIDSEPIHSRVKMDTFAHFDLPFDEADLVHYMGRTSRVIFGDTLQKYGRTDVTAADMAAYKHDHYLEVLESGEIEPVPGCVEFIKKLHEKGFPIALATSSNVRAMNAVLDSFGIRKYFTSILSGGELPESKPHPAIYLISAQRLGVKPEACMVVEDTTNGIRAAKAAGMYCVAYRNPNSGEQDLSQADEIVNSFSEINI